MSSYQDLSTSRRYKHKLQKGLDFSHLDPFLTFENHCSKSSKILSKDLQYETMDDPDCMCTCAQDIVKLCLLIGCFDKMCL